MSRQQHTSFDTPLSPKISKRALSISVLLEALFAGALCLRFEAPSTIIELIAFGMVLLWVSNTDLVYRQIPNNAIITALLIRALFLAYAIGIESAPTSLIGDSILGLIIIGALALAASLTSERFSPGTGLGGGDLKLLAVAGFYFGPDKGLLVLFLACIAALISYAFHRMKDRTFPFAPDISLACAIIALL